MNAFITGSHAYGTPKEDSDIDLAVLVSEENASLLWAHGINEAGSIRFGKLNMVVFYNDENFYRWKKVNDALIKREPVTRDEAISAFQEAGFRNYPTKEQ